MKLSTTIDKEVLRQEALDALNRLREAYKDDDTVQIDPSFTESIKMLEKNPDLIFHPPKRGPKPRFDMNNLGRAVLEVIKDGEWHKIEEVIDKVSPLVPPGVAWRHAEKKRQNYYTRRNREPGARIREVSQEAIIFSGRRSIARKCINDMNRQGRGQRIEVEWNDPSSPKKRISKIKVIPYNE